MRSTLRIAAVAAFLVSFVAFAQEKGLGSALKDKEAVTFNEIERGFFLGVGGGPFILLAPPSSTGASSKLSPGQMATVEIGMDLGERLSLAVFFQGTANRAGSDYVGKSGGSASGDYSAIAPGASLRANLVGFADVNDVKRTWVYARVGAGFMMFSPKQLLPDPDILVFGGPGVEYYTRLRHFSVGIELTGAFLLTSGTLGFALTPNLRYAF